jgi:hypothetical protein
MRPEHSQHPSQLYDQKSFPKNLLPAPWHSFEQYAEWSRDQTILSCKPHLLVNLGDVVLDSVPLVPVDATGPTVDVELLSQNAGPYSLGPKAHVSALEAAEL